ncbi:hypothetical protein GTA08_BOTSDO03672 [Botryosphaeria dothidea]|uniref:Uncharacterized protein n=1 Tax=Botryosphaeria dothidea TaxID=55169 RepID=A0A8H4N5B7_9PEZI|nr:hypothetical protein GTA08_BOTSDO03672 [Botryosphaeria dothidea]
MSAAQIPSGDTSSMNGQVFTPEGRNAHDSDETNKNMAPMSAAALPSFCQPAVYGNVDWHLPRGSWDTHVHVFEP